MKKKEPISPDRRAVGAKIRDLRRSKYLTQEQLARKCDCTDGFIGMLETGKRALTADFLEKLTERMQLDKADSEELIRLSQAQEGHRPRPFTNISAILSERCKALGAKSWTFYMHDRLWPKEWSIAAMEGVEIREPMHGFVSSGGARRVLQLGPEFCTQTERSKATLEGKDGHEESDFGDDRNSDDEWMKRRDTLMQLPNMIPDAIRSLFGDFVDREGVKASARLTIEHDSEVIGILFVNFDQPTTFDESLKRKLKTLCVDVGEEIKGDAKFRAEDVSAQQAVSLLRRMQEWVADIYRTPKSEISTLNTILADMMSGLGMDVQRGFGTIHLYRSESNDLVLKAHRGLPLVKTRKLQSVIKGEGILSWVALRRCSMFIENIQESKFSDVYISLRAGMTSALAVPMMERDELVGVLNFESEKPNQFREQDVRALWYAARAAAVAIRLRHEATIAARRAQISGELLKWQGLIIGEGVAERKAFNAFARIACNALEASEADFWKFDTSQPGPFSPLGATYPLQSQVPFPVQDQTPSPEKGLSDYVCRSQTEIWITNVQGSDRLNAEYWNKQGLRWDRTPPRIGAPESTNHNMSAGECAFELGIPLVHEGECLGIAWLKFTSGDRSHPSVEEMSLAEEFAQGVGCIMKFWPTRDSIT